MVEYPSSNADLSTHLFSRYEWYENHTIHRFLKGTHHSASSPHEILPLDSLSHSIPPSLLVSNIQADVAGTADKAPILRMPELCSHIDHFSFPLVVEFVWLGER